MTYTCALCHGTFEKGRSDEEALAESRENFGAEALKTKLEVICDDCYNKFMTWYLSQAEHE